MELPESDVITIARWLAMPDLRLRTFSTVAEEGIDAGYQPLPIVADYLLCRMIEEGPGCVEDHYQPERKVTDWRFFSRRRKEETVLFSTEGSFFRPFLAHFAGKCGISPYGGHTRFRVRFDGEEGPCPERFELFLCNQMETGCWMKVYLYGIDGVWPFPEMFRNKDQQEMT